MSDFALLPPEVNSTRMYTGSGSAPMLAAAAAWAGLAVQWDSAASAYRTVVTELTAGPWQGPTAVSMAAAARRYVAWMQTTADRAGQVADQLWAAAGAYEQAFAATVPPSAVAGNRAALALLVATNFFGQNTPAIAANWAEYAEMWAQDAAAMYSYAANSTAAAKLSPFPPPPQTTGPVTAFAAAPVAGQSALSNLTDNPTISALNTFLADLSGVQDSVVNFPFIAESIQLYLVPLMTATGKLAMLGGTPATTAALEGAVSGGLSSSVSAGTPGLSLAASFGSELPDPGGAGISAGIGRATPVGELSVPPSWDAAASEARLAGATLPASHAAGAAAAGVTTPGIVPPVGNAVNTAADSSPRARLAPGSKADRHLAGAVTANETGRNRWAPGAPAESDWLSEGERNELDGLRREMAELADECDAMTRLMMAAMR